MPISVLTARDAAILAALDRTPLTAVQLLKVSATFPQAFQTERVLRRRMARLHESGLVRRARYTALAGRGGMPAYYLLTPAGYRMLQGPESLPPKRCGVPRAPLRHQHTHLLAEVLVHLQVAAHRSEIGVTGFCRENSVRLSDGGHSLFPDAAFQLETPGGATLSYFVEIDNSTERLRTNKEVDSWEQKIRVYQAVRSKSPVRFRVIVFAGKSVDRLTHILELAQSRGGNPRRVLFLGTTVTSFLQDSRPLHSDIFRDQLQRPAALVPSFTNIGENTTGTQAPVSAIALPA